MKSRIFTLLTSKAVWGAVLSAGAWLTNQQHVGAPEIVQAAGGVLTAIGVRDSITKATQPPTP